MSPTNTVLCKAGEKIEKEWVLNTGRHNLSRQIYSCLMSIPGFRYRFRLPKRETPNPARSAALWPVCKAALNAKCPDRIEELFELGPRPKHFAREDSTPKRHSGQGPFEGGHWATPGALMAPMKVRTTQLAVPRLSYAKNTRKNYGKRLTERQRKLLDIYIDNATKTIYYSPPKKRIEKRKRRSPAEGVGFKWPVRKPKGKKFQLDMALLSELALPKPLHPPPEINRGKTVHLEDIMESILKLYTLPARYKIKRFDVNKLYQVKKGALEYTISDRVAEIALPKRQFGEPPFNPYKISQGALTCTASERTVKLATPREHKPPPDESKEDPFSVPPRALKAMCTPRTAELAEPRGRK